MAVMNGRATPIREQALTDYKGLPEQLRRLRTLVDKAKEARKSSKFKE